METCDRNSTVFTETTRFNFFDSILSFVCLINSISTKRIFFIIDNPKVGL